MWKQYKRGLMSQWENEVTLSCGSARLFVMSPVWLSWTAAVNARAPAQHKPPESGDMRREKQEGMPLICDGVQMGEGCLRADMSWHVPSLISFLLSVLCLLMIREFPPSFLPFLPPSFSFSPFFLPLSGARFSLPSSLLPLLSCLLIISDHCRVLVSVGCGCQLMGP